MLLLSSTGTQQPPESSCLVWQYLKVKVKIEMLSYNVGRLYFKIRYWFGLGMYKM